MTRMFTRILLPLALSLAAVGQAAPAGQLKIGVINIQQAILLSNEGQRDFGALQKKFEPKDVELQNLSKEVEDLKKQLSTTGDKLNEEARNELVKKIEQKQKTLQRTGEDAQADFQGQQQETLGRILQKFAPVLQKYATDNAYSLILDNSAPWPQGQVVWAIAGVDITKPVVDMYNAQSGVPAPPSTGAAAKPAGTPAARPATTPAKPATTPAKPAATKPN